MKVHIIGSHHEYTICGVDGFEDVAQEVKFFQKCFNNDIVIAVLVTPELCYSNDDFVDID